MRCQACGSAALEDEQLTTTSLTGETYRLVRCARCGQRAEVPGPPDLTMGRR